MPRRVVFLGLLSCLMLVAFGAAQDAGAGALATESVTGEERWWLSGGQRHRSQLGQRVSCRLTGRTIGEQLDGLPARGPVTGCHRFPRGFLQRGAMNCEGEGQSGW